MNTKSAGRLLIAFLFGLTGLLFLAKNANADEGDPPSRVARISYMNGSVSFQPGGSNEWGNATLNHPMTIGDRIWTDSDGRAELQAGAAAIHMGEKTALSFLNLDDRTIQMRMAEGQIHFHVRELRNDEIYELDAPNLAFTVTRAGAFRVDVNENGDVTSIIVFSGEGDVTAAGQSYKLHEGERGEFRGSDQIEFNSDRAPAPDDFDRWAMDRDGRGEHSASARYVSRDVIGYEDLDDHGSWRDDPDYGHVWYPSAVDPGWAPYRYGHWVWISPWGWTWVDDASWGFAPFHYGRWAFIGGSWGWCPGPFYARPVFGPAFVGFVGGRHFGFGFGPPVAWFPLGFREPFFPWFRSSSAFITRINVSNTFIRDRHFLHGGNVRGFNFVHAHNALAVTAVSQRTFVSGGAIGRTAMRVTPGMLRNAEVSNRTEVSPTRQSVMGAAARGRVTAPPSAVDHRAVVTRGTPAQGARDLPVRRGNIGAQGNARNSAAASRPPSTERSMTRGSGPNSTQFGGRSADRPSGRTSVEPPARTMNPGRSPEPSRPAVRSDRMTRADRPPGAGASAPGSAETRRQSGSSRGPSDFSRPGPSPSPRSTDRSMPSNRSYEAPRNYSGGQSQRYSAPPSRSESNTGPSRSYSGGQSQRYSAPPSRSYSNTAPPRSYSAPPRSYSAPRGNSSGSSGNSSHGSSRGSSGGSSGNSSQGSSRGSSGGSSRGSGDSRGNRR